MRSYFVPAFVILFFVSEVSSSAIPIWEMLTYQEKMGRLMYTFVHLVERYCRTSSDADCRKVMTLHGISNLLNYDEHSLDLLDPDQRNASRLIWQAATKSQYKYPTEKSQDQDIPIKPSTGIKPPVDDPYEASGTKEEAQTVVVPAPSKFFRRRYWNRWEA